MICTVCGADNPATATICHACKGFLQNRVPTLDLFRTAWRSMTAPSSAFHEIAIAEHKNYAVTLFSAAGIPILALTTSWLAAGNAVGGLFETTGAVVLAGAVVGPLVGMALTGMHATMAWVMRGDVSFRRSLGLTAYTLVPLAGIGLPLLPIALMTFGEHWFTGNPAPATINAVSYWTIMALQGAAALWSVLMLMAASRVGLRVGRVRAAMIAILTYGVVGSAWWWIALTALRAAMSPEDLSSSAN